MRQFFPRFFSINRLPIMEPLVTVVGATGTGKSKVSNMVVGRRWNLGA